MSRCGKVGYASLGSARKALGYLRATGKGTLRNGRPYRCKSCNAWHLTSR